MSSDEWRESSCCACSWSRLPRATSDHPTTASTLGSATSNAPTFCSCCTSGALSYASSADEGECAWSAAAAPALTPSATMISALVSIDRSFRWSSSTTLELMRESNPGSLATICSATARHVGDGSGDVAPNGEALSEEGTTKITFALVPVGGAAGNRKADASTMYAASMFDVEGSQKTPCYMYSA